MGLIHALRSSAEAALGDDDGPLRVRAARDGVRGRSAAERSLNLLEMLQAKTAGNLTETERDALWSALRSVRARLDSDLESDLDTRDEDASPSSPGDAAAEGDGDGGRVALPSLAEQGEGGA